jgi:precorrin-3B C17-methyltransferase
MSNLYVVGVSNGKHENLTIKADTILKNADYIYCDSKMYEELVTYYPKDKLITNTYNKTFDRCMSAIKKSEEGYNVAIVGSGDTGIYGMSSIVLENADTNKINVVVIPGISFILSGAAALGSPLQQDFVVITLSDNLMEKENFLKKIKMAISCDLNIVFYSPMNPTNNNLKKAIQIIKKLKDPKKAIVGIAKNVDSENQEILVTNLEDLPIEKIDSFTTVFICKSNAKVKDNKIITPLVR